MIICDADISPRTGTGKYYIGKTVSPNLNQYLRTKLSFARRGYKHQPYLFNAMRKYADASSWRIHSLMRTLKTDEDIKHWEKEMIALMKSRDPQIGYNITEGGEGSSGMSLEGRHRIAEANRHRVWSDESRSRCASPGELNPSYGRPLHEATKKGHAQWLADPASRVAIAEHFKKVANLETSKQAVRDSNKRRKGEKRVRSVCP